ncbi:MAG: ABC transporter ATP-binding protein [Acidobacteriaceae bacterium]
MHPIPQPIAESQALGNESCPHLELRQVTKLYHADASAVIALDNISLQVKQGEFLAFAGRSGCGKSTLLNVAGAMDFPSSGEVRLDGLVTSKLSENQLTALRRQRVGFVFQSFQLLQTLSVIENVELPLMLASRADARQRAHEMLEWVELAEYAQRLTHQLSGGQMQRVAIARALVHRPSLLLADEPTGNLDTNTGNTILALLRRVAAEYKTTILMATHSIESAAFADATVNMRDGRIASVVRH